MKRTMTFRFRKTDAPVDSHAGFYFCELAYRHVEMATNIPDGPGYFTSYLMTRDHEGIWRIVPSENELPDWIYKYETSFGNAIDESLGINSVSMDMILRYH